MMKRLACGWLVLFPVLALQPLCADETLQWTELPQLPDRFGFGGPIVGVHNEALIVAGGANFPDGPPWPLGDQPAAVKVWHDRIFVLESEAKNWIEAGKLPTPLAYAPAISTREGVYVLGGETYDEKNHPTAKVLLLQWDPNTKQVTAIENALPPLPKPCQYHNAAIIEDAIYVTASHARDATSQKLDQKSLWSLDLNKPGTDRVWTRLKPWPGAPREKMAVAVQYCGGQERRVEKCLYMFSGTTWFKDTGGQFDLTRFEHFTDAYRYNPKTSKWNRIADLPPVRESREINLRGYSYDGKRHTWRPLKNGESQPEVGVNTVFKGSPRPAGAATAMDVSQSQVLLFSGATGRYITLDIAQRPLFPSDVLSYQTTTDEWSIVGRMPMGVVTTGIVKWNDRIVIPSGEIRPGVRTNKVQALQVKPSRPAK